MNMENTSKLNVVTRIWLWICIVVNAIILLASLISFPTMSDFSNDQYTSVKGQVWKESFVYQMNTNNIPKDADLNAFSDSFKSHCMTIMLVYAVVGVLSFVFIVMLFKKKKIGFWGLIVVAVAGSIAKLIMFNVLKNDITSIGGTAELSFTAIQLIVPISILVLWALLQIRKDGVSCWNQLR